MRLNKAQKEVVLKWIAEGLETDEINQRAAKFKPRFQVLRSQVDWYRKTRGVKLGRIQEDSETDALKAGFALKQNRVATLQKLADKMVGELLNGERLWLTRVKGIGTGESFERVEYLEFNRAEMEQLRGVLDDIAMEVGERIRKTDLTTGGKPLPRPGIDPKQLKNLSNDELAILEHAAEILEHGAAQESAVDR